MSTITIGQRIKCIRKKHNITQTIFGNILGISHSHVSNIESGKENPSHTLILMICSTFDINKDWLLYGDGEMDDNNS